MLYVDCTISRAHIQCNAKQTCQPTLDIQQSNEHINVEFINLSFQLELL